jgi:uncharacterized iron-regulated protein
MSTVFFSPHLPAWLLRPTLRCLLLLLLSGCSWPMATDNGTDHLITQRLAPLLPADALLLGEQHDAPDHQRIEREVVQVLAARNVLAALAVEMAEQGHSTAALPRNASEDEVRAALQWNNKSWPWASYGPAVMAAVSAGVPVLGANLPRTQMRPAMDDRQLELRLKGPALKAQQQLIRFGHCEQLPEGQIMPMTRIQIARDIAMAQTVAGAAVPGKTVLLLADGGHVDRSLGVPQHLPAGFKGISIGMQAESAQDTAEAIERFDAVWSAKPAPEKDYCADFKASRAK